MMNQVMSTIEEGVDPKAIRKQMADWSKKKKLKFVKKQESPRESNQQELKTPSIHPSATNDLEDYKAGLWSVVLIKR